MSEVRQQDTVARQSLCALKNLRDPACWGFLLPAVNKLRI